MGQATRGQQFTHHLHAHTTSLPITPALSMPACHPCFVNAACHVTAAYTSFLIAQPHIVNNNGQQQQRGYAAPSPSPLPSFRDVGTTTSLSANNKLAGIVACHVTAHRDLGEPNPFKTRAPLTHCLQPVHPHPISTQRRPYMPRQGAHTTPSHPRNPTRDLLR